MAVRVALGASRSHVMILTLSEGLRLALAGSLVGLVGVFMMTRAMQSILYGTSGLDVPVLMGVLGVLVLAALLACAAPARHAASVDPMHVLRAE